MITIMPLSLENQREFNRVDARFLAGDRVQLRITRKGFELEYAPLSVAEWRLVKSFPAEPVSLMQVEDAICYLAFVDGRCAGQSVMRLTANHLCELQDIRTDIRYRRQRIASELLNACVDWARSRNRPGLYAEASDAQPVACQFFESRGMVLGGVDRLRHAAESDQVRRLPAMRDSALFFYKLFSE